MGRTWVMYDSYMDHIGQELVMYGSYMDHVLVMWVLYGSRVGHTWVMYGSCESCIMGYMGQPLVMDWSYIGYTRVK